MTIYFISRHAGARAWARRQGIQAVFLDHLTDPGIVRPGDDVLGVLPIHLAAAIQNRGAKYYHLNIDLPFCHRGVELTPEQMAGDGVALTLYEVRAGPSWDPTPPTSQYNQRPDNAMPWERDRDVPTHSHFRQRTLFSALFGCAAALFALAGAAAYESVKPLVPVIGAWFAAESHRAGGHEPWIPGGLINLLLSLLIAGLGVVATYYAYAEFRVRFRYDITRHHLQPAAADILILPVSYPDRRAPDGMSDHGTPLFIGEDHLQRVLEVLQAEPSTRWGRGHAEGPAGTSPSLGDVIAPDFWAVKSDGDHRFHNFAWQTGFQTVQRFLGGTNEPTHLRCIHLIPSITTKDLAEKYYAPMLRALVAPRDSAPFQPQPTITVHDPVDYTNFTEVQKVIAEIVETDSHVIRAWKQRGSAPVVMIDVTGGTASFSAVAAIQAAGTEGILYSHVVPGDDQNRPAGLEVRIYGVDAVAFKGDV